MSNLLQNLRRLLQLPGDERLVVLASLVALPLVHAGLRFTGCLRAWAFVLRQPMRRESGPSAARVAFLVHRCAAAVLGDRCCLARSVYLGWLLRRHGVAASLKIGVARTASGVDAHAWLEVGGSPLAEDTDVVRRFVAFPDLHATLPGALPG